MYRHSDERDRIILFHAMAVVTWLIVPLAFSTETLDPGIHLRFTVWAGCLAVLGGWVGWIQHHHRGLPDVRIWCTGLFLFAALYLVAAVSGIAVALVREDWLYATLRTAMFLSHLLLAAVIFRWNADQLSKLAWYAAAMELGMGVLGLVQWDVHLFVLPGLDPPYGLMFHENLFAEYLFLCTPLTLYGAVRHRGWRRVFFTFTLAVTIAAVVAATTRSVWAALTIGFVLTVLVAVMADRKLGIQHLGRIRIQKRFAALIVVVLLLVAATGFVARVSDQFDDLQERTMIWRRTIQLTFAHPVLGIGAGNWVQYTNIENLRERISQSNWIRPHNDPLWVASETGVPGLIGYLGLFIAAFWMLWRVLHDGQDLERKRLAIAVIFALTGFLLISNSSFPRERIEHTAVFALYLGLTITLYSLELQKKSGRNRAAGSGMVAWLIVPVALFAGVDGAYRVDGETHVARAHALLSQQQWAQALPEIEQARNPFYSCHPNGLSLDYMRGISLYELKRFPEALESFQRANRRNPNQIITSWYLGRCYLHLKQFKLAEEMFRTCLDFWPDNIFTLPGMALAELEQGNYEAACRHLYRYRIQYDPSRHRESYEKLWEAIRVHLTDERMDELEAEEDVSPPQRRRQASKQQEPRPELLREKGKERERLGIEPSRDD